MSPAEPSTVDAILATDGLVVGYDDIAIVHGVDICVPKATLAAVVGPNGSGKSTLLKGILGIARVLGGRVSFEGRDITGAPIEVLARRGIGYVPQVDDVFSSLRVVENLEMGGYLLRPRQRAERLAEVLEIFPALKKMMRRYVHTLSGGEQKMTAVGRALMLSPRLLILDEPTAGLSELLTRTVLEEQARALADRGTAVLLVEQKAALALELADWAYVLVRGRIERSAPASVIRSDAAMAEIFLGRRSAG